MSTEPPDAKSVSGDVGAPEGSEASAHRSAEAGPKEGRAHGPMARMERARETTLELIASLTDEQLRAWPDPAFSPICWHIGHVAFTEAQWVLGQCIGDEALSKPHFERFAQNGCAKSERAKGFDRPALLAYLHEVRAATRERWPAEHALARDGYLDWFLACHEHQHRETIALVLAMTHRNTGDAFAAAVARAEPLVSGAAAERWTFGGEGRVGTHDLLAYDNERPSASVSLEPYALDARVVSAFEWRAFLSDAPFETPSLWDDAATTFLAAGARLPRPWREAGGGYVELAPSGARALRGPEPVWGVSLFEARAYARWAGADLPTEDEWEFAARTESERAAQIESEHVEAASDRQSERTLTGDAPAHADLASPGGAPKASESLFGGVWQWTKTPFYPREGFVAHPYEGYSSPYFDGIHHVLRGGSFATDRAIARATFRNWFVPETRQIFCGLRLRHSP
ncbi:MAG: SUMF1/EgtB/PvdO family nonheme iron enzyme [Myxococcota bacterium]